MAGETAKFTKEGGQRLIGDVRAAMRFLAPVFAPNVASAWTYLPAVIVKITGNAAGGGIYTGRIANGGFIQDPAATLSLPGGLTLHTADDAIVYNLPEDGRSTHLLSAGDYLPGLVSGMRDGKVCVMVGIKQTAGTGETLIHVTGNATPGAMYTGKVFIPFASIPVDGTSLSVEDLGEDSDEEVYVINRPEIGKETHDLTHTSNTATLISGIRMSQSDEEDALPMYIGIQVWPGCSSGGGGGGGGGG